MPYIRFSPMRSTFYHLETVVCKKCSVHPFPSDEDTVGEVCSSFYLCFGEIAPPLAAILQTFHCSPFENLPFGIFGTFYPQQAMIIIVMIIDINVPICVLFTKLTSGFTFPFCFESP
ncbi:hypothetical protein T10_12298 [Trichinella papuae]|uniref:Uncharacterized protein n=1 Tax=Trichinella papuae TaxID=268474 RepID=A0A0V1M0G3_9BILA|nr:hypothetical protein T10_4113 [Trichinella papuae]KRZ68441.1 hypothetical protein T10_12298 [Trichinella papuae]